MTFDAPEAQWPDRDLDERGTLDGFLDGYRAVLSRKASGLDRDQLATELPPSPLTLGGLVKHMAFVEDYWFTEAMAGQPAPEPWASVDWDTDHDWELHSAVDDTPDELFALLALAVERSRDVARRYDDLDTPMAKVRPDGAPCTLRWIYVHMIEEYARHCGHADLIRESIDGAVGD